MHNSIIIIVANIEREREREINIDCNCENTVELLCLRRTDKSKLSILAVLFLQFHIIRQLLTSFDWHMETHSAQVE